MIERFKRSIEPLLKDRAGATAVEFAMVITPLLMLLLGLFQLALVFFYDQALQSAARASARLLMTGAAQKAGFSQSQFRAAVCSSAKVAFDCNSLMVDVQSSATFNQLNTAPIVLSYNASGDVTNSFSYAPGGASSVVIVRLLYRQQVWWPLLLPGYVNQPGNKILLTANSVLKSEPYQ